MSPMTMGGDSATLISAPRQCRATGTQENAALSRRGLTAEARCGGRLNALMHLFLGPVHFPLSLYTLVNSDRQK